MSAENTETPSGSSDLHAPAAMRGDGALALSGDGSKPRARKSDAATIKLLKDMARLMANHMWHLQPHTEGGKLYQRVEEEIARLEQPTTTAPVGYTHADVAAAHAEGYRLGLAQEDRAAIAKATGASA